MVNHPNRSGHYVPIGFDNRGTVQEPFGFVYLGTSAGSKEDVGPVLCINRHKRPALWIATFPRGQRDLGDAL